MVVFEDEPSTTGEKETKENESFPEIVPDQKKEGHEKDIVLPEDESRPEKTTDLSSQAMNPRAPGKEVEEGELSTSNSSGSEEEPEGTPKIRLVNLNSIICREGDADEEEDDDVLVIDENPVTQSKISEPESDGEFQKSMGKDSISRQIKDIDVTDGSKKPVEENAIDINSNQQVVGAPPPDSCKIPAVNDLVTHVMHDLVSDVIRHVSCEEQIIAELDSQFQTENDKLSFDMDTQTELRCTADSGKPIVVDQALESEPKTEIRLASAETVEDELSMRESGAVSPSLTAVSNTDSSITDGELDLEPITDTASSSSDTNPTIPAGTITKPESDTPRPLSFEEFKSGIERTYLALNEGSESPKYSTEEEYREKYDNYLKHIVSNGDVLLESFQITTASPTPIYNEVELRESRKSETTEEEEEADAEEEDFEVEDHDMFESSGSGESKDDEIVAEDSTSEELGSNPIELGQELTVDTELRTNLPSTSASPSPSVSSRLEQNQSETQAGTSPLEISSNSSTEIQPITSPATTSSEHLLQPCLNSNTASVSNEPMMPSPAQPGCQIGASPSPQLLGNLNTAPMNNMMGMGSMANMAFQNPLFQLSTFLAAMQTMGMNPFMNFTGLPNSNNANANPAQTAPGMPPIENNMNMQAQMAAFANMFQQFQSQQFLNAQNLANQQLLNAQTQGQPQMTSPIAPMVSPGLGAQAQPALNLNAQNLNSGTQQPFGMPNFGNFGFPFGQFPVPGVSVPVPNNNPMQSIPVPAMNLNPVQQNAVSNNSCPIPVSTSAATPSNTDSQKGDQRVTATAIPQSEPGEPNICIRTDVLEKGQNPLPEPQIIQDPRAKRTEGKVLKRKISLENYRSKNKPKDLPPVSDKDLTKTGLQEKTPAESKSKNAIPAEKIPSEVAPIQIQVAPATSSSKIASDKSKDTWKTYDEAKSIPRSRPLISGYMEVVHPTKPIRREKTPPPAVIESQQPPISTPPEIPMKKSARDFFDEDFQSKLDILKVKTEPLDNDSIEEDIKPDISLEMETEYRQDSVYSRSGSVVDQRQVFEEADADRYSRRSGFDSRNRSSYRDTERHSSSSSDPRVRSNGSSLDAGEEEDLRVRLEARRGRGVAKNNRFERSRSRSRSPPRRFGRTPERVRHREDNGSRERSPDFRNQHRQGQGQGQFHRGRGFNRNDRTHHAPGKTRYDYQQRSSAEVVSRKYERSDQDTRKNKYERSATAQDYGNRNYDRSSSGQEYRTNKYDKRAHHVDKFDRSGDNEAGRFKTKYENRLGQGSHYKSRGFRGHYRGSGNPRPVPEKYFNTEAEDWEAEVPVAPSRRSPTPERIRSRKVEVRSPIRGSSSRKRTGVDQPDQASGRSRADPDAKKPRKTVPERPVTPEPAYVPEPGTENYFNSRFEDWDSETATPAERKDDSNSRPDNRRRQEPDDIRIRIPPPPVNVPVTKVYYVTGGDQPMSGDYAYNDEKSDRERDRVIYDRPSGSSSTSVARRVEYVTTTSRVPFVPSISYGQSGKRYVIQEEGGVVYDYMHGNGNAPLVIATRDRVTVDSEGNRTVKPGQGSGGGAPTARDPRFDWEDDD